MSGFAWRRRHNVQVGTSKDNRFKLDMKNHTTMTRTFLSSQREQSTVTVFTVSKLDSWSMFDFLYGPYLFIG